MKDLRQELLRRLQAASATYDKSKWEKEFESNNYLAEMIRRNPSNKSLYLLKIESYRPLFKLLIVEKQSLTLRRPRITELKRSVRFPEFKQNYVSKPWKQSKNVWLEQQAWR